MEEVAGSRVTGGQRLFNVNVTPVNCQQEDDISNDEDIHETRLETL